MGVVVGEPQGSVEEARASKSMEGKIQAYSAPVIDAKIPMVDLKNVGLGDAQKKEWNTKHLGQRLGVDVACAATAGGLVAPLITVIDKYVSP